MFKARGQNSLKVHKGPEVFSGRVCSSGRNLLLAHVREQRPTHVVRPQHPDALVLHGLAYQQAHSLPINGGPQKFFMGRVRMTGQSTPGCPCSAWRNLVAAVPFRPPVACMPLLAPVILPVGPTCGRALSASFSLLAPFGPRYSACCPYWPLLAHCHPLFASLAPFSLVAALPYSPLIAYWPFLAP